MIGKQSLKSAAPTNKYKAKDGAGTPTEMRFSVFPIMRLEENERCNLVGTGFFICDNGIFVSAKHVFEDVVNQKGQPIKPLFVLQFLPDNTYMVRDVERGIVRNGLDVGIGILKPLYHKQTKKLLRNHILKLTTKPPEIGETISTYAYPNTEIVIKESKQDLYLYPDYYEGQLIEYYPNGRDRTFLPGPCYQTTIVMHGGASGGPVFRYRGKVFGVNSTGFLNETISFVSRIDDILDISLYPVSIWDREPSSISIRELTELGYVILEK